MAALNSFRKIVATSLSSNFRKACEIIRTPIPDLAADEVLVKNRFLGINATDINVTAGRYTPGKEPPLDVGLEGVGEVVSVGDSVPADLKGKSVGYIWNGAFAEYIKLPSKAVLPVPDLKPQYVPLLISGLTAAISLDQHGQIKKGETVLVTAAAGGTGHLAVQLAKQAGCHVIATCSTKEKSEFLKFIQEDNLFQELLQSISCGQIDSILKEDGLGCDRVINHKEEKLYDVLKNEYPRGIDVAYESIGGDVFEASINRIAIHGRIIVLGFISSYLSPGGVDRNAKHATVTQKLLLKSASLRGFFLFNHKKDYINYFPKLVEMVDQGNIRPEVELNAAGGKPFVGLEGVFDGVEYLYSKESKGKVVIDLEPSTSSKL